MTHCPHGRGPSSACSQCLGVAAARVEVKPGVVHEAADPFKKGREVLKRRARGRFMRRER